MPRIRLFSIYLVLTMAACSAAPTGGPPAASTGASPVVSDSPAPSPAVDPGRGSDSPVPVAAGKVTVSLGAQSYSVGAAVSATIANGLDRPVYTEDFKTECTIATLQRLDSGSWTDITGCRLGRPTMTVSIGPGLGRTVQFDPNSFHLNGGRGAPGFGAGIYRVKFTYRFDSRMGEEPLAVYSPQFAIK